MASTISIRAAHSRTVTLADGRRLHARVWSGRGRPLALGNRLAVSTAYRAMVAKAVVRGGLSARAFHRRRVDYGGPVVVVWGDRDRIVPQSHVAGVATAFPHADSRVWRAMGHHHQVERPTLLAGLVEATCQSVDGVVGLTAAAAAA